MPVQRHVNHFRITLKNLLRSVSVVSINVKNQRRFAKHLHGDCHVVEVAEATSVNSQSRTENPSMMSWWTHQRKTAFFRSEQRGTSRKPRKLVDVVVRWRIIVLNHALLQV